MNLVKAHNHLLSNFDKTVKEIRKIHMDMHHVNEDSKEYNEACDNIASACRKIFAFKNIVHDIEDTTGCKNLTGLTRYTKEGSS